MFKTTRTTVYKKFEEPSIQQYLHTNKNGHRLLLADGMNEFTMLMANSKAGAYKQEINTPTEHDTYRDEYIQSLKEQIELLKKENERYLIYNEDLKKKYDSLFDIYLTLTRPQPQLEAPKRSILDMFRNNKKPQ
jgi:hypothetical protein